MTGDQRRWPAEAGATGHIHFFDPFPYSFKLGETAEEVTAKSLTMLREQIAYEGPPFRIFSINPAQILRQR